MSHTENPWTILDQRPVYENQWIQITEFDVLNPPAERVFTGRFITNILQLA